MIFSAGSVLQGSCVLDWIAVGQLCVLCESNLNLPHTLQHSWATALFCHSSASAAPADSHLGPLPYFTDLIWDLRRQPRLPSVSQTLLDHSWCHLFGTAKCFLWTNCQNLVSPACFGAVACGLPEACAARSCFEKNRKWGRQTGVRQSHPLLI